MKDSQGTRPATVPVCNVCNNYYGGPLHTHHVDYDHLLAILDDALAIVEDIGGIKSPKEKVWKGTDEHYDSATPSPKH